MESESMDTDETGNAEKGPQGDVAAVDTFVSPTCSVSLMPAVMGTAGYAVAEAPPTIRYIPNFITEEEEALFVKMIYMAPKPKWQQLLNRRLQNWGGIVGKNGLISDDNIPEWLDYAIKKIMLVPDGFPMENRPNHVLINEYSPGQGIMAHTDGPAFYPLVSTISLLSDVLVDYYKPMQVENQTSNPQAYVGSMFVKRRSLLLLSGEAYCTYLHGIKDSTCDLLTDKVFNLESTGKEAGISLNRETRISMTIRNVPRVRRVTVGSLLRR